MSLGTIAEFASIFFIENAVCTEIIPGPHNTAESMCETDGQSNDQAMCQSVGPHGSTK